MSAAETAPAMITVERVSKRYGDLLALDSVDLRMESQVVALLGANGAGKSTLLKMIVGLVTPDTGVVRVGGHDTRLDPVAARRMTGYLPEDLELYERLTGREFVRFVSGIKGLPPDDAAIDAEFEQFGILDKADHLIREYSLGMKKKTGLIAAFTGSPRVLVLDEPLNALDAYAMRLVAERVRAFHRAGGTVLMSSHVMSFVERVCERVVILRSGAVVADGAPGALRTEARLGAAPFDDVFFHYAGAASLPGTD